MLRKIVLLAMLLGSESAIAGGVVAGATEITQILNNMQLVLQYEQQIEQYVKQGQQYQTQLTNLVKNPTSSLSGDASGLIQRIGGIMSAGQAMGGSLARIDAKFVTTFNSPTAASYSDNFKRWTDGSKDTLQSSMQSAGLRRDQYATDADALQALYNESQSSGGNLAALQTLSKINIQQVQQTQALGDLMATQNIASSTYMAAQASKEQAKQDNNRSIMGDGKSPLPNRGNKNSLLSY